MTLKELAIDHAYYCSDSNYYSREAAAQYDTWEDFISEMGNSDIDYNLCFRFDIKERETEDRDGNALKNGKYCAEIFMMQQRKGKFVPIIISSVEEKDTESIVEWISARWEYLKQLWLPFK